MTTLALGPQWLDPDYLISTFGLIGILVIIFAEIRPAHRLLPAR